MQKTGNYDDDDLICLNDLTVLLIGTEVNPFQEVDAEEAEDEPGGDVSCADPEEWLDE